jgi:WXG100 family type VII secretion target
MFDETGGGGHTQAETAEMTSAAKEAGETGEALKLMLSNLLDNLEPLSVAWTGVAGAQFQKVKIAVTDNMNNLYAALTSIADSMGISSSEYAMTDDEIAADLAAVGDLDSGEVTRLLDSDTTEVSEAVQSGANPSAISEAMNTA